MFMRVWLLLAVILISSCSALRISEVMYAPNSSQGGEYNEWIELHNNCSEEINLTGWKISERSSSNVESNKTIDFLNSSQIISPFNYFIIAKSPDNFYQFFSNASNVSKSKFILNNDAEIIKIYSLEGLLVDELSYNDSFGASGNGYSLQFFNGWKSCPPTPGGENYCLIAENETEETEDSNKEEIEKDDKIEIEIYSRNDIEYGDELEVKIKIINLNGRQYDLKGFVDFEGEIISEILEGRSWKSGIYYITGLDESENLFKIRIKKNFKVEYGDAQLIVKLRENGKTNILVEDYKNIEILKGKEEKNKEDNAAVEEVNAVSNEIDPKIVLNSAPSVSGQVIYESKNEKIQKYSLYAFCVFLIFILGIVLLKR